MFQTKFLDKIKTHVLCSVLFVENRVVCDTEWKNAVRSERQDNTAHACCMLVK